MFSHTFCLPHHISHVWLYCGQRFACLYYLVDGYVDYGGIFDEIRTFATFKCFEIGDSIITAFLAVGRFAVVDGFIVMAF